MSADRSASTTARSTLEHAMLTLPQQARLDELREQHPDITITVDRGPAGSAEASVTYTGPCPMVEYVFGHDAGDMLGRLERALSADPDTS